MSKHKPASTTPALIRTATVTGTGGFLYLAADGCPTLRIPVASADAASALLSRYRDRFGIMRITQSTEKNPFLARAIRAHHEYRRRRGLPPQKLDATSRVEEHGSVGEFYVVLRSGGSVAGVYRILEDGAVHRVRQYPTSIE
jgi:hypothetical protein